MPQLRRHRISDQIVQDETQRLLQANVHSQLAQLAVAPETARRRSLNFSSIEHFLGVHGVCNITEEAFLALCVCLSRFYRASRLEALRAALVWRQLEETPIERCLAQTTRFRRRFKGATRLCLDPQPRGSITFDQLTQLTEYCREAEELEYARGFAIAYFGLLRHSEMALLRRDDVETETATLRVRGGKGRLHYEVDIVLVPEVQHLLTYLKNVGTTVLLLPYWNKVKANALICAAAAHFKWNKRQSWSFHCLRHGGAGHLTRQGSELSTRLLRGRWMSAFSAEAYSIV